MWKSRVNVQLPTPAALSIRLSLNFEAGWKPWPVATFGREKCLALSVIGPQSPIILAVSSSFYRLSYPGLYHTLKTVHNKTRKIIILADFVSKQAMYCNVTLRRVRATTVAVNIRSVLGTLSVRLKPPLLRIQSACAILYCHL